MGQRVRSGESVCGHCAVKHGRFNGGLNIYGPLDPPLQCAYSDG